MSRLSTYVRSFDREFTELIRKRDGPKGTPELQVCVVDGGCMMDFCAVVIPVHTSES